MADKRISDFTEDASPSLADTIIESIRSGVNYKNTLQTLLALAPGPRNVLTNSDFSVYQRQFSRTTLTTKANNTFGPDRWYLQHNGTLQVRGYKLGDSGTGSLANGFSSFGGFHNVGASSLGLCVIQVIPLEETCYLRGKFLCGSVIGLVSTGTPTLNIGVWGWNGSVGSSSAKDIVASWSSNVPTFRTTNHDQKQTGSATLGTGAWVRAHAVGSIGGSDTHAIIAAWSIIPASAALYLTAANGTASNVPLTWQPRPNELDLCQRFCFSVREQEESSFGNSTQLGNDAQVYSVSAGVSLTCRFCLEHPPLRKAPTLTATASDWQITDPGTSSGNSGNNVTSISKDAGRSCATRTVFDAAANHTGNLSTLAVGDVCHVISAAAASSSLLILDAED